MSSHWSFFPISRKRLEDRFLDVSAEFDGTVEKTNQMKFDADKSGIGKTGTTFQPKVEGENAYWDFYDPDEWERQQIGVFSPEYDNRLSDEQRVAYKEHMRIQMAAAKEWRKAVLGEDERIDNDEESSDGLSSEYLANFPPFVAFATDKIPTVNQILRRRRQSTADKGIPDLWNAFENPPEGVPLWTCYFLCVSLFLFSCLQSYWGVLVANQIKKAVFGGEKDGSESGKKKD